MLALLSIQTALESVHPALPWGLLTLLIFIAVYATRKFAPKIWALFDQITPDGMIGHVLQGLPSVLTGALLAVLANGGSFKDAWLGALSGALAPVLHLLLKASPLPYQGAVRAAKTIASGTLILLLITGCAGSFEEAKMAGMQERAARTREGAAELTAASIQSDYCRSLDSGHRFWDGTGKVMVVGGGGLAATAPLVNDDKVKIGMLIGSAVLAAGGAGAIVVSDDYAAAWARDCD